jgi:hypothetical protein
VAVVGGREIVIEGVDVRVPHFSLCIFCACDQCDQCDQLQVVVCATGYDYNFPFLKRSSDSESFSTRCSDDDPRCLYTSWDRHVVEPL